MIVARKNVLNPQCHKAGERRGLSTGSRSRFQFRAVLISLQQAFGKYLAITVCYGQKLAMTWCELRNQRRTYCEPSFRSRVVTQSKLDVVLRIKPRLGVRRPKSRSVLFKNERLQPSLRQIL